MQYGPNRNLFPGIAYPYVTDGHETPAQQAKEGGDLAQINFGTIGLGQHVTEFFTVWNPNSVPIHVAMDLNTPISEELSGSGTHTYYVSNQPHVSPPFALQPGQHRTFEITFTGEHVGALTNQTLVVWPYGTDEGATAQGIALIGKVV